MSEAPLLPMSREFLRDFLFTYRREHLPATLAQFAETFPTRQDLERRFQGVCNPDTWEIFMLQMLDEGIVGMDGFKYCWPEVASENRRKILLQTRRIA